MKPAVRAQGGAATVELALVLPILLGAFALVVGAGWFGAAQAVLDHGAREGVRYAAVGDARGYPDDAAVAAAVDGTTPLLTPTAVVVEGDAAVRHAPVRVVVTYELPNPVAVLLAPLEVVGVDNPVGRTVTLTASAEGRRE